MESSGNSSAMDDSIQPLPTTPFSASSPSFSSLSSSSAASQSAPSSFSSTFPSDTTATFTQSSPSFTPFTFPAVPNPATTSTTSTTSTRPRSRPFRDLSNSRPRQPLLHAGSKRGSLSRDDDDDDDDAIDDDLPARPLKRLHEEGYGRLNDDGDEEEDEQAGLDDEEFKDGDVDDVDVGEDTFSNLLTHFAALHVPTSSTKPEQCPICSGMFPLSEFADHVYSCLTVLDDVEKKEQERLDEKMARQLMAREVRLLDESERHSSYSRDRRQMGVECSEGAECQRTNAQHFQLRTHPEVACPVCGNMLPLFDIYAHVTGCVQDEGGEEGKQVSEREPGGMEDEMSEQQQNESRSKAAIDTSSSAFSSFRADKQRREMADDDSHLPIARDSDDEDDDRKASPSPPLDPALARTASASPPPAASTAAAASSDLRLTVEQASAVASMIKEKREKGGDESVAGMLETFKQLGFTQENLTRLKEAQQGKVKSDDMDRKG